MRRNTLLALALSLSLVGCGGDEAAAPDDGPGVDITDSPPVVAEPPPKRDPLTEEQVIALSKRTVEGFTGSVNSANAQRFTMQFRSEARTAGGAKLFVMAKITPCDAMTCFALSPKHNMNLMHAEQARKSLVDQGYVDPVYDVYFLKLADGVKANAHWSLAYKSSEDGKGSSSVQLLTARYTDKSHEITLHVNAYEGGSVKSLDDLKKRMTREEAEAALKAVFAVYADVFEPGGF